MSLTLAAAPASLDSVEDHLPALRVFQPDPEEHPNTQPCRIHPVDRWRAACDTCTRYHLATNLALGAAEAARARRAEATGLADVA